VESSFYIIVNIKTLSGYEAAGRFYLGNNGEFAQMVFSKLKGSGDVNEKHPLQMDFIEKRNSLPVNLKMISCNLEEIAENCKIITKELFTFLNLDEPGK
jgi:hypothetical protein